MAKTKTKSRSGSRDILRSTNTPLVKSVPQHSGKSVEDLLSEASDALERSQPENALPYAEEAVSQLESTQKDLSTDSLLRIAAQEKPTLPVALNLCGDIALALGDVDRARSLYENATRLDPEGALVSAEPWLQLAQICEEGGSKSIEYFDKAIEIMKNEIEVLEEEDTTAEEHTQQILEARRWEVANALCGMAEVYMTDLSWEPDAEARCEQLVTEAVVVCPERLSAGPLQTLASVRISQERFDEARKALAGSMSIWKDILPEVEDPARPDFATRISLARLLMEVEVEKEAFKVLEGLVKEDDQSVEAWYLGGWCQVLLMQKPGASEDDKSKYQEQARAWLGNCLRLYKALDYEDDRLHDHAHELVRQLNQALGIQEEDEAWEDVDEPQDSEDDIEIEANGEQSEDGDVEMS